jgi:hypothetical protein
MVRFGKVISVRRASASCRVCYTPETVAVDDQFDQPISVTVPVALEGSQQLVHLALGEVLPDPVGTVPPAPF